MACQSRAQRGPDQERVGRHGRPPRTWGPSGVQARSLLPGLSYSPGSFSGAWSEHWPECSTQSAVCTLPGSPQRALWLLPSRLPPGNQLTATMFQVGLRPGVQRPGLASGATGEGAWETAAAPSVGRGREATVSELTYCPSLPSLHPCGQRAWGRFTTQATRVWPRGGMWSLGACRWGLTGASAERLPRPHPPLYDPWVTSCCAQAVVSTQESLLVGYGAGTRWAS